MEFLYWNKGCWIKVVETRSGRALKVTMRSKNLIKVLVAQSCPTLCNPMGCSLPGSSVHGILQARILEWAAISFSRKNLIKGTPKGGDTLKLN